MGDVTNWMPLSCSREHCARLCCSHPSPFRPNSIVSGELHIKDSVFIDNSANYSGGCVHIAAASTLSIANSDFINNAATLYGGQ